jgi:hypothetical protein
MLLILGSIEGGAQLWYRYQFGTWYSRQTAADPFAAGTAFERDVNLAPLQPEISTQVVHPYLGFVFNVETINPDASGAQPATIDRVIRTFGFTSNSNPLPFTRLPGQINILITGGSVGGGLLPYLQDAYNRADFGDVHRRKAYFFAAALGGYKQPQQAIALLYFLSVGAKFDLVINIDGYNEITLPYSENCRAHTYPFFPRAWRNRIADRGVGSKLLGEIIYLDNRKEYLMELMKHHSLYYSATAGLYRLWQLNDTVHRMAELAELVNRASLDTASFEQSGPYIPGLNSDDVIAESVDVWSRSSQMMQSIAAGAGIEYFHVLQPNQYVKNSKTFTAQEKAVALVSSPTTLLAAKGYELLIARGKSPGLNYFDATNIFTGENRTVYADACCHLNQLGNEILAAEIIRQVNSRLSVLKH